MYIYIYIYNIRVHTTDILKHFAINPDRRCVDTAQHPGDNIDDPADRTPRHILRIRTPAQRVGLKTKIDCYRLNLQ